MIKEGKKRRMRGKEEKKCAGRESHSCVEKYIKK